MIRCRHLVAIVVAAVLGTGAPLATTSAAGAAEPFTNGSATADAQVVRVAPGVGSLSLAMTTGVSIGQVTNSLAQASAQSIDTGLIGSSLTAESCGQASTLKPNQLPAPTVVDNRKGNASASSDEIPVAGSTLGGGREIASADTVPSARGAVSELASVIGPVATISAGRSTASARIVDKKAREAESTASGDIDIAGVVQLKGALWRAFHRTGAGPATSGTFSIAEAAVGGVPLPIDQFMPVEALINMALAPSGISVSLPQVTHITKPVDLISVTPLRILLKDSPAGKTALGPGLNLTRPQREQLFSQIVSAYCKAAGVLLVGDVAADIVSGTGFMSIEVGGVEALSGDLAAGNPFGTIGPYIPPVANDLITTPALAPSILPGVAPDAGAPPVLAVTPADLGPIRSLCESENTASHRSCSRGLAVPVGIAAVVLAAAVGYLDWRRRHRAAMATTA